MRGNGPHSSRGNAGICGNRVLSLRQQDDTPTFGQLGLALVNLLQQFMRGRQADDPHKRRTGNAHPRQVVRGRKTVLNRPAHDIRLGKVVSQKAEARHLDGKAKGLGLDFNQGDFQHIAGLRAFDINRPGQRMHDTEIGVL